MIGYVTHQQSNYLYISQDDLFPWSQYNKVVFYAISMQKFKVLKQENFRSIFHVKMNCSFTFQINWCKNVVQNITKIHFQTFSQCPQLLCPIFLNVSEASIFSDTIKTNIQKLVQIGWGTRQIQSILHHCEPERK